MTAIILTWLLSVLTLLIGLTIGYLLGSRKIDKKIEAIEKKLAPAPLPPEAGPIRPKTSQQKVVENPSTAEHRLNELL